MKLKTDSIIYQLVNYEHNKGLLNSVMHIRMLDLAIVFKETVHIKADSRIINYINNDAAKEDGLDEKILLDFAAVNTPKLYKEETKTMEEMMSGYRMGYSVKNALLLYIISNKSGVYGATSILYDGVLNRLSDKLNSDLIILPCSIHEMLAIPFEYVLWNKLNISEFSNMVYEINRELVTTKERMSDNVYLYMRQEDKLIIIEGVDHE